MSAPREAWLTIDDSPSPDTGALTDFLADREIPAILFCRGDRLAGFPKAAADAVAKGFILANHAYSHRRAGTLPFDEIIGEIEKTERLIEAAYKAAGKTRQGKYFRFPHMDRGCGGWVVDYDAVPKHCGTLKKLFADGLNIALDPPSPEQIEKKRRLQDWLKREGFSTPFSGITFPWYTETEMATAIDAMYTFSTSDWMLTARHIGRWPYKTLDYLKQKIDSDPWLQRQDSRHVILAHDQPELLPVVTELVGHMTAAGLRFVP